MLLGTDLERVPLGSGPTPVRELAALDRGRGTAPVWIKDDWSYSPVGGNKARKLEWLLADARRRHKTTVLTGGALGTNHGLATATFARRLGMRTVLVLAPQPRTAHVDAQLERLRASGAELHYSRGLVTSALLAAWLTCSRSGRGHGPPYLMPPGGSTPLGCVGYVRAALELRAQIDAGELPEPSHVVVALGSGGTAAGLLAGMRLAGLRSRLLCVAVSDVVRPRSRSVSRLARRTLRLLRAHGLERDADRLGGSLRVEPRWLGRGYGHATAAGQRAIDLLGEREGVHLDPVYTAKAMAALLALNRVGAFGAGPVLYWHTYSHVPPEATDPAAHARGAEEAAG